MSTGGSRAWWAPCARTVSVVRDTLGVLLKHQEDVQRAAAKLDLDAL
ncbi:hypothetical protein [Streptomyces collinus]